MGNFRLGWASEEPVLGTFSLERRAVSFRNSAGTSVTDLATRFQQIFNQHDGQHGSQGAWQRQVIADLCTVVPQPSREQLKTLLWCALNQSVPLSDARWIEDTADRLMAWATMPTALAIPKWCEHWERHGSDWCRVKASGNPYSHFPGSDWDICPVRGCHAPRPTDGSW